jgi:hypothetical protein
MGPLCVILIIVVVYPLTTEIYISLNLMTIKHQKNLENWVLNAKSYRAVGSR